MEQISGMIRAAIDHYNMIDEGDKISVGVSGGKDSLVLLYALSKLREYYSRRFELVAILIDPQFNGVSMNLEAVEKFCREINIELVVKRSDIGRIVFDDRKEKNPCSLCARMRRGILHNISVENGCNKIALGHHYDDAVQTFFMNLFNSGKIGCFSPKTYLDRKKLWLIRPMIFCPESKIKRVANKYSLPIIKSQCPADDITSRAKTEDLLKKLEKMYPDLRAKVMGAMQRAGIDGW